MTDRDEHRRLAAIVMADVVGYSRLMGADEAGTLATMTRQRRTIIDPAIAAHRGRLVNSPGDSLLVEFSSVVDAVRFAITFQQAVRAFNADQEQDRRLEFRVGVNVGDVIVREGSLFGDGVNVAARLEQMAEAGGICISRSVYEQIRASVDGAFVDLGAHAMKNIARPVDVYGLSAAAVAAIAPVQTLAPGPSRSGARRLAVIVAVAAVGCSLAAVATILILRAPPASTLRQNLLAEIARALPTLSPATREKLVETYLAIPSHRAIAFAPKARAPWYSGEWQTREDAADKTLERCQLAAMERCAVLAIDDQIEPKQGESWPVRDMPRAHYAGSFDPYWIPGVRASAIKRPEIKGYLTAAGAKAIAYNIRGLLFVVAGEMLQHQAEERSLQDCNDAGTRNDIDRSCLLYAVGNQVVLPEGRTRPKSLP